MKVDLANTKCNHVDIHLIIIFY